jgi:3-hydroxyacyl-CoA dehydrogenase
MIGCGSMGGGMALLFTENGLEVSLSDPSEQAMDKVVDKAKKDGFGERIKKFKGERMFNLHIISTGISMHLYLHLLFGTAGIVNAVC